MKKPFILFTLLASICAITAHAQFGLDPTFGNGGVLIENSVGIADIGQQADGKLVAVGSKISFGTLAATRFNSNGSRNNQFGYNGIFDTNWDCYGTSIAIQPDGKIVMGISSGNFGFDSASVIRLLPTGQIDNSFGKNGFSRITYKTGISILTYKPEKLCLQPDGKILLANEFFDSVHVVRLLNNGSIDSSFGKDGHAVVTNGMYGGNVRNIALMADGRIVVGGDGDNPAKDRNFMAMRFMPNGKLDTSFNHTGILHRIMGQGGILYGRAMALQPDGKIILAGSETDGLVWRFNLDGSDDTSFNHTGVKILQGHDPCLLVLQPNGKILVGCQSGQFGNYDYGIFRLNPDGSLDNSFGNNGLFLTDYQNSDDRMKTMLLQSDGKIVFTGGSSGNQLVYRVMPNAAGIDESPIKPGNNYTIYPNPANELLYIQNNNTSVKETAVLYDVVGREMNRTSLLSGTTTLSVSNLPPGNYTLQVCTEDGGINIQKFVVVHP